MIVPTLDQIQKIHDKLGKKSTLTSYLRALHNIGVAQYVSFIIDGHSEYFCVNGEVLISDPIYDQLVIASKSDKQKFLTIMDRANSGKIGYMKMCKQFAGSGIDRWIFDTGKLTISYLDVHGQVIYRETVHDIE